MFDKNLKESLLDSIMVLYGRSRKVDRNRNIWKFLQDLRLEEVTERNPDFISGKRFIWKLVKNVMTMGWNLVHTGPILPIIKRSSKQRY